MKKIYNELFDETYYTEKLDNGLEIVIFHKPQFLSTSCAFGTTYGALNINQRLNDEEYSFNPGIAHFLEHKLFESEENDIFTQFSNMGCNVNAFTSYNETVYYFSTTSKDIIEPLNLLLNFVQSLNITDASVEKEKDIIIQELSMYMQNSNSRMLDEGYKSLYFEYPLKYDIGGNAKTVNAISKEELEKCYKLNYHPSSMALIIVTPHDPEMLMNIIKENQSHKDFTELSRPIDNNKDEPIEVKRKDFSFKMDINKAKHLYAIKLLPNFKDQKECSFKEWCLNIYLKSYFSPINPSYQEWLDKGIINDFFGYEVNFDMDFANILFYTESNKDNLKELVDSALKEDLFNEDILQQTKRRYIGESFDMLDSDAFGLGYIRDYLNGNDFFENINILSNITLDDIKRVYNSFDYSNYALIHILPSGK